MHDVSENIRDIFEKILTEVLNSNVLRETIFYRGNHKLHTSKVQNKHLQNIQVWN